MLNKDSKKSVQEVMLNYNCGKFEICEHYEIERAFYGGAKGYDYTGEDKKVLATDFEIAFNAKNQIEVSTENQDYIQTVQKILNDEGCLGSMVIRNKKLKPENIFKEFNKEIAAGKNQNIDAEFLAKAKRVFKVKGAFKTDSIFKNVVMNNSGYTFISNTHFLIGEPNNFITENTAINISQQHNPNYHLPNPKIMPIINKVNSRKVTKKFIVTKQDIETFDLLQFENDKNNIARYIVCKHLKAILAFTKVKELELWFYDYATPIQVVDTGNPQLLMILTYTQENTKTKDSWFVKNIMPLTTTPDVSSPTPSIVLSPDATTTDTNATTTNTATIADSNATTATISTTTNTTSDISVTSQQTIAEEFSPPGVYAPQSTLPALRVYDYSSKLRLHGNIRAQEYYWLCHHKRCYRLLLAGGNSKAYNIKPGFT